MKASVGAAVALLVALLLGAVLAPPPPSGRRLEAPGGVLLLLVPPTRAVPDRAAWAVVPGRDLETAYRLGRLKPEPGAAALGPALRAVGVRTRAFGAAAERLLEAPDEVGSPMAALGPGVCVAAEWSGPLPNPPEGTLVMALPTGTLPGQSLPPVFVRGAGIGALTSPSTRTVGLVAATDLPATVLRLFGGEATVGVGRSLEVIAGGERRLGVRVRAWERQNDEQALRRYLPWALAALVVLGAVLRRRDLWIASASASLAFTVAPALVLWTEARWAVYAVATGLIVAAGFGQRWLSLRGIAWVSVAVFVWDALQGGFLTTRSPLSWAPLESARFYGVGNEAAGAWLGAAGALATLEGGMVGALLLASAAVGLGAPGLGANAGGALAALVGLGVHLTLAVSARRRWLAAIGALVGVASVVGWAVWRDSVQGAGRRSHVGEAVVSSRARGGSALVAVASRKAALNARLLVTSPWSVLLVAGVAGWFRSGRPRAAGFLATDAAAFALNDSGVLASAVCGLWLPATSEEAARSASAQAASIYIR